MDGERQSQIDSLIHRVLTKKPGDRASFLENACPDAGMREEVTRTLVRLSLFSEAHSLDEEADPNPPAATPPDHRAGKVVGVYRILRRIGQGGMGEVYLAMDTRLERHVALKFLPARTTGDEMLVRRFQLEARTASSLNHPNILTIFDVGKIDGEHFIASEFVDGITLRSRLREGPLEFPEAIEIVTQAASALVAAHSAGVIHRDLKPTNIMIRPDGYIKLIDFGLAKLSATHNQAKQDEAYTRPGTMVGTVDYMSPEQARGDEVDSRSDIWSLGVVLYEMLTGRKPFDGKTDHHVIVNILEKDPPPLAEAAGIPKDVQNLVDQCLRKDPKQRYGSAEELSADLRRIRRALNLSEGSRPVLPVVQKRSKWMFIAAGVACLAMAAALWWLTAGRQWLLGLEPFEIGAVQQLTFNGDTKSAAISPEGRYLAYISGSRGHEAIWIKRIDSSTESVRAPVSADEYDSVTFSHDGQDIYYVARKKEYGRLYKVPLAGGDPRLIVNDIDGPITFKPNGPEFAFRRNVNGTSDIVIATPSTRKEQTIFESDALLGRRIAWSPDSKTLAATIYPAPGSSKWPTLALVDADPPHQARLMPLANWRATHQFVWLNRSDLIAPTATNEETDDQMQLREFSTKTGASRNLTADMYGYWGASLTRDAQSLVTVRIERRTTFWTAKGDNLRLGESTTGDTGRYETVDWSDNGLLISQANRGAGTNVWMVDPADSHPKKLTDGLFVDRSPVWIHGANAVAFASNRGGSSGLWSYDLDTGQYKRLVSGAGYIESPQCSPDGNWLVYTTWKANQPSIWRVASTGGVSSRILSQGARHPVFSPDGKRIAAEVLAGPRDTEWRVTIFSADTGQELQRLPTIPSGARLAWYPDGQALTYILTDDRGVSNIWRQPLSGNAPNQITSFQENQIFDYGWSRDGEKLACLRGRAWSDAYLLQRKP